MLSTYQINTMAAETIKERVGERKFDRSLRNLKAKEIAQRNLRREVERLLKVDGNIQSVVDVLESVAAKSRVQSDPSAKTACCS